MGNFGIGDFVTLNTPEFPNYHGKKGKIEHLRSDAFIVGVTGKDGRVNLVEVTKMQLVRVVTDAAFDKFRKETLPELTKQPHSQHNAVVEQTVSDDQVVVFQAGVKEGYINGFSEGYVVGYQAAMADVQQLFVKHGFKQAKPGDDNGNIDASAD